MLNQNAIQQIFNVQWKSGAYLVLHLRFKPAWTFKMTKMSWSASPDDEFYFNGQEKVLLPGAEEDPEIEDPVTKEMRKNLLVWASPPVEVPDVPTGADQLPAPDKTVTIDQIVWINLGLIRDVNVRNEEPEKLITFDVVSEKVDEDVGDPKAITVYTAWADNYPPGSMNPEFPVPGFGGLPTVENVFVASGFYDGKGRMPTYGFMIYSEQAQEDMRMSMNYSNPPPQNSESAGATSAWISYYNAYLSSLFENASLAYLVSVTFPPKAATPPAKAVFELRAELYTTRKNYPTVTNSLGTLRNWFPDSLPRAKAVEEFAITGSKLDERTWSFIITPPIPPPEGSTEPPTGYELIMIG